MRFLNDIQTELAHVREERASLEHEQNPEQASALQALREQEQALEKELEEKEAELAKEQGREDTVFESYFGKGEKDADADKEAEMEADAEPSVFESYFEEPEAGTEEPERESIFAELVKEDGLMDRLTEHVVDAALNKDQEPEM